ncbi:MAG TPA: hypothetical protein VMX15_05475, partial [Candidatus Heimdallarchaeota archaeon]|nr:hypothetical protein [Candidatus Heimdallarchaeota archaeon]
MQRIDFLLPFIRTAVLPLPLDSWVPYDRITAKPRFNYPPNTANSLVHYPVSISPWTARQWSIIPWR